MPLDHSGDIQTMKIVSGEIYDDDWVTPELILKPMDGFEGRTLELTFWNPDFSVAHLHNSISATLGRRLVSQDNIRSGQTVTITADFETDYEEIEVKISSYLDIAPHDQRRRAMKLVSAKWLS